MKNIIRFIPNSITITRIIMTFIFLYFIAEQFAYGRGNFINLMVMFLAICFSDLLDGKIARGTGSVSIIGAKLDVFADLLYIILSYTTLIILKMLSLWFLVFVCLKFLEFVITSKFIKSYNRESNKAFVFDKVGRLVSATFFIIPGIVCIYKCFAVYNSVYLINYLLYTIFAAEIYSSYLRIKSCFMMVSLNNSKCEN